MSSHFRSYKNNDKDAEEMRRKRMEGTLKLRKSKRDELLSKFRKLDVNDDSDNNTNSNTNGKATNINECIKYIVSNIQSSDSTIRYNSILQCRKMLSKPKPPITEIILSGLLPIFLNLIQDSNYPKIQLEGTWCLTNISSGISEQTKAVVDAGGIPILISLLASDNLTLSEQALWAIGNIVGDGSELRDICLEHSLVDGLYYLLQKPLNRSFILNVAFTVSNICSDNKSPIDTNIAQRILQIQKFYLTEFSDVQILLNSIWGVRYLSNNKIHFQCIIDNDIPKLLLNHVTIKKLQRPIIRTLGNIIADTDDHCQHVLDMNIFAYMPKLLDSHNGRVVKDTLRSLGNIAAGSLSQIQALIDSQLMVNVVYFLTGGRYIYQKESTWIICNIITNGTREHIIYLISIMSLAPLCKMLKVIEYEVVYSVLNALSAMFQKTRDDELRSICNILKKCGGFDYIEQCQMNENKDIYNVANDIISNYFNHDTDTDEKME